MWPRALSASVLAAAVLALALRFSSLPFFWIGLAGAGLLIWLMLAAKRSMAKAVMFNLAVVFATLAAIEAWLESKRQVSPKRTESTYTERYFDKTRSLILGYRPYKDTTVDSRRWSGDVGSRGPALRYGFGCPLGSNRIFSVRQRLLG